MVDSQHNELISVIKAWNSKGYYPSYDEIAEFVAERFHIYLDIELIRKYINHNCSFSSAIGVSFDNKRLECKTCINLKNNSLINVAF